MADQEYYSVCIDDAYSREDFFTDKAAAKEHARLHGERAEEITKAEYDGWMAIFDRDAQRMAQQNAELARKDVALAQLAFLGDVTKLPDGAVERLVQAAAKLLLPDADHSIDDECTLLDALEDALQPFQAAQEEAK